MTVQNGLGAEEIVGAHGDWPLLSSVTFMSGTRHEDTHVEYVLDTATWIGPYRGTTPADARAVADLIVSSGLKAEAFDDLRPAQWSKLIFNATVNAVAALTGLPHDFHFAETEQLGDLGNLVRDLVDEGKAAAAGAGIELLGGPVGDERARHAARPPRTTRRCSRTSRRTGRTEIETITGSLVREAQRAGVDGAAAHGAVPARQGEGGKLLDEDLRRRLRRGRLAVRRESRAARRRRGRGRTTRRASTSTRSTRTGCASPAPATSSAACARRPTPQELPPCDFGIVATKAMHTEAAIGATAHAFADGCVATVQNGHRQRGGDRRARRARDPRHDVSRREDPRARTRAVGREGRHHARARSSRSRRRSPRWSGSPMRARAAACRRRRSRTRAARSGGR